MSTYQTPRCHNPESYNLNWGKIYKWLKITRVENGENDGRHDKLLPDLDDDKLAIKMLARVLQLRCIDVKTRINGSSRK